MRVVRSESTPLTWKPWDAEAPANHKPFHTRCARMFDLRGKPGYDRFPLHIGDDVVEKNGGPVMMVVDFDDKGQVTVMWRSPTDRLYEKTVHHAQVLLWEEISEPVDEPVERPGL